MSSIGDSDSGYSHAREGSTDGEVTTHPRQEQQHSGTTGRRSGTMTKAEARAMRKAKRDRDARLSKSVQAPRFVGYEDESARLFSARDIGSLEDDCSDPGESNRDIEVEDAVDQPQDDFSNIKDAKAAARAMRQAKRELDAKMGKMVEAPRTLDYEDESSRFFGDTVDPLSRNTMVADDTDDLHFQEKKSPSSKGEDEHPAFITYTQSTTKIENPSGISLLQGGEEGAVQEGDELEKDKEEEDININQVAIIRDSKAHARALKLKRREERLANSTEAPRMKFGYEFESAKTFHSGDFSDSENSDQSDGESPYAVKDGGVGGLESDKVDEKGRESPQSINNSHSEEEEESIEKNLYSSIEDLCSPTAIHSKPNSLGAGRKDGTHDASDFSLSIDDLRLSADRNMDRNKQASLSSLVSDLSVGMDDIEEGDEEEKRPGNWHSSAPAQVHQRLH